MPGKLIRAVAFVAVLFILRGYLGGAISEMPQAYTLSDTCAWKLHLWARLLGADSRPFYNLETAEAEWGCHRRRGLKSRSPFINTILPRWPSASQRRTWEMTNEDRDPLPAQRGRSILVR